MNMVHLKKCIFSLIVFSFFLISFPVLARTLSFEDFRKSLSKKIKIEIGNSMSSAAEEMDTSELVQNIVSAAISN